MAVRDGERFLEQAVRSVLGQTLHDLEFIIVDDGSTDATPEILGRCRDDRLQVISVPVAVGQAAALNRAISAAEGEFIARQDADDVSLPQRLQRQVEFMRRYPAVGLCGVWARVIDGEGQPTGSMQLPVDPGLLSWRLLFDNALCHSSLVWRREAIATQVGSYAQHLDLAQDYDLIARVAERFPVANLPQVLLEYRVHGRSKSISRAVEQKRAAAHISHSHLRRWLTSRDEMEIAAVREIGLGCAYGRPPTDSRRAAHAFAGLCRSFLEDAALSDSSRDLVRDDACACLVACAGRFGMRHAGEAAMLLAEAAVTDRALAPRVVTTVARRVVGRIQRGAKLPVRAMSR